MRSSMPGRWSWQTPARWGGKVSLIRLSGMNASTLRFATDGGDNLYNLTMGTGTIGPIVSGRATAGPGDQSPALDG